MTKNYSTIQDLLAFLLTRPSRDVTKTRKRPQKPFKFLLTRPSRDVTEADYPNGSWRNKISTHTSLAGRDLKALQEENAQLKISTHTSLAGRDKRIVGNGVLWGISTHTSLAGRDVDITDGTEYDIDFYSHVPRGT